MAEVLIFVMDEFSGKENGPYTLADIQTLIHQKKLKKKHLVRKSDYGKWYRAKDLLGKAFDTVEQQKIDEKQQAKDAKKRKRKQAQREKEIKKEKQKEIDNTDPYILSETDNQLLATYFGAMRAFGNHLRAWQADPNNDDLKQTALQSGQHFVSMTATAQSTLPNEPIKDFDEQMLLNLFTDPSAQAPGIGNS